MHILFLSRWYPYPPNNGSKIRIYNLLRGLAQQHELTLISFIDPGDEHSTVDLESLCKRITTVTWHEYQPGSRRALAGLFSSKPRSLIDTYSPEMEQAIRKAIAEKNVDLVIASQVNTAMYVRAFKDIPSIFEEAEVGVLHGNYTQAGDLRRSLRHGLTWMKHRRYLAALIRQFPVCTVASEKEFNLISSLGPGKTSIHIIPNFIDLVKYSQVHEEPDRNRLIFTGSFTYNPNFEAMEWFIKEVFPYIQKRFPDVYLTITGKHAGRSLPSTTRVRLTGLVQDVRVEISRSWVSLVPMHTGGGTRLKILEAMALGTPVVATSKGAEGINVQNGRDILIADSPAPFADAVCQIMENPQLRSQISENALKLLRDQYDFQAIMPRFVQIVNDLGSRNYPAPTETYTN